MSDPNDPNDPNAGVPGPPEAETEPVPVGSSEPAATPPPTAAPPPTAPPPPQGVPPPMSPPAYPSATAPPSQWEVASRPQAGPAPGYAYVGFWRRFAATLIDGILFSVLFAFLAAFLFAQIDTSAWRVFLEIDPATGRSTATNAELIRATSALFGLWFQLFGLYLLAHFLYHVILWTWLGGTLGQLALGIQVRRESDGRRIGLGTAILRYIGYLVSAMLLYIGLIWVAFDRRKQGWHDKIAGTLAIRRVD
jgi:uncharacterized RDD family membrane protein YckC